jgi:putative FmdB family regulatory protein
MPIYEYQREDGTVFQILQKINDNPLQACPSTGQKVERIISLNSFHLAGGGWFKTSHSNSPTSDTGSTNASSPNSSESNSTSNSTETNNTNKSGGCAGSCACH